MNIVKGLLKWIFGLYHRGFCRIMKYIKKQKDILLYCASPTMEQHILDYYYQIKDNNYNVSLYYPSMSSKNNNQSTLFYKKVIETDIKVIGWMKFCTFPWDLIVSADLSLPYFTNKEVPLLYINHGLHIVSYDNGKTLYAYGARSKDKSGRPKFNIMLEPNKRIAEYMINHDKSFKDVIKWSGYKFAEDIIKATDNYYYYRQQLGVSYDTTLVGVFGTWNRESLFHILGEELFHFAQSLRSKGYQFIFSIHPKEYMVYNMQIRPMGPLVEAQREKGFIVRSPSEDWLPYLIASDIIICDYSSMYELAIIAEKKIILSDFPANKVWEYSIAAKVKKQLPVLKTAENLEKVLNQVKNCGLAETILEYKSELINKEYKKIVNNVTEELLNKR